LKAGPIRSNASKGGTLKLDHYKLKDRQRSKVLKKVNIGDNGFKDLNSWESIERRLCVSEDRLYEFIES